MTPKEKALELYHTYKRFCSSTENSSWKQNAKECATIAVDEIMNMYVWDNPMDETHYGLIFWGQTKEEINKL